MTVRFNFVIGMGLFVSDYNTLNIMYVMNIICDNIVYVVNIICDNIMYVMKIICDFFP